ncbi:PepSY domain-containing protein [bacterium]|nr:PepSY domain-containing protein [bacterium]
MNNSSSEHTPTNGAEPLGSKDALPTAINHRVKSDSLYRVIWRWHFYAGMIIAPVLIIVAATGAIYCFKDELEAVIYPGVTYVEPTHERVPYAQQLATARAAVPPNDRVALMQVFTNPTRATTLAMAGEKFRYVYVDPYRGKYLGSIEQGGFFDIVLHLHRQLLLGTTGRIVIELTTCWTIVLAATGIFLWWPSKANQVWGVWLPRLRRTPYVVLRDLHSVAGIYVAIVAIMIALTGLYYGYTWGSVVQYASQKTDAYDMFSKPMLSKSSPDAKDVSIDRIVAIAQQTMPDNNLTVWFPRVPNAVYLVTANNDVGPSVNEMLFIDRVTGEILEDRFSSQTKLMYQLGTWSYPLHVGTIGGMPTRLLWLATCIVLMTLPVTGTWMWWERRPTGKSGLPRRVLARRPRWLILIITVVCILLPAVGISALMFLLGDIIIARWRTH